MRSRTFPVSARKLVLFVLPGRLPMFPDHAVNPDYAHVTAQIVSESDRARNAGFVPMTARPADLRTGDLLIDRTRTNTWHGFTVESTCPGFSGEWVITPRRHRSFRTSLPLVTIWRPFSSRAA